MKNLNFYFSYPLHNFTIQLLSQFTIQLAKFKSIFHPRIVQYWCFCPHFCLFGRKYFLEGEAKPPLLVPTIWNHSGLWQFSLHILQRHFSIPTHQHTHVLLRAWQRGIFSPSLYWSAFSSSHISNRPVWIIYSQCTHSALHLFWSSKFIFINIINSKCSNSIFPHTTLDCHPLYFY